MKVTVVIRTPVEGGAGDFYIEGVWAKLEDVSYKKLKHHFYDIITIDVKEGDETGWEGYDGRN